MPTGAVHYDRDRDAVRVVNMRCSTPALRRSAGLGSVFFPPNGAFVIAPSIVSQVQSIPSGPSTAKRPKCQNSSKTPVMHHSWNVDARNCWNRCRSRLMHSIDTPYRLQTVSHPSQRRHSFSVYEHHTHASYVAPAMAPTGPKSHSASASYRLSSTSPG
jgi:hypothetical protein